jgi:hypothetical protein
MLNDEMYGHASRKLGIQEELARWRECSIGEIIEREVIREFEQTKRNIDFGDGTKKAWSFSIIGLKAMKGSGVVLNHKFLVPR